MKEKQSLLSAHAKSFNWAGFFLSEKIYKKCSVLYDFCRTIDDIADENNKLEIKKKKFEEFKLSFKNKDYTNTIIKNIWELLEHENISEKILEDLFNGIEDDLIDNVNIKTKKDLFIYSYRVAGTVGLMMSKILKVKDSHSMKGAIDLGIAMQLTNIARDVIEDKKKNRSYISGNLDSIKETVLLSEIFYESSFSAIKSIPIRCRFSIIVAKRVYRKIGMKILKQKNIDSYEAAGKIYVTNFEKVIETFLSIIDFIMLYFISSKKHLSKNAHIMINESINLNDRI